MPGHSPLCSGPQGRVGCLSSNPRTWPCLPEAVKPQLGAAESMSWSEAPSRDKSCGLFAAASLVPGGRQRDRQLRAWPFPAPAGAGQLPRSLTRGVSSHGGRKHSQGQSAFSVPAQPEAPCPVRALLPPSDLEPVLPPDVIIHKDRGSALGPNAKMTAAGDPEGLGESWRSGDPARRRAGKGRAS